MNEQESSDDMLASVVLAALERLDDTSLHAVAARAQGYLLDRPAAPGARNDLTVEVVDRAESLLLATYRALKPAARRRLLIDAALTRQREAMRATPIAPIAPIGRHDTARPAIEERDCILAGRV